MGRTERGSARTSPLGSIAAGNLGLQKAHACPTLCLTTRRQVLRETESGNRVGLSRLCALHPDAPHAAVSSVVSFSRSATISEMITPSGMTCSHFEVFTNATTKAARSSCVGTPSKRTFAPSVKTT